MSFSPVFQNALVALPTVSALRALVPGGLEALPEDVYDALRRDEMREALDAGEAWFESEGAGDRAAGISFVLLLEGCDRLDRAVEVVEELREAEPASARLALAEAELRLERLEDGRAGELLDHVLDHGVDTSELDGVTWGFVADLLLDVGRDEEAIECMEIALELGAEDFETAIRLAKLHEERENWRRAAEEFERAAEIGGDVVGPWREAAECWRRAGALARSLEAREHVLAEGGGSAEIWAKQGLGYRRIGEPEEAIDALERATRLAPDRPVYWIELADVLRENRRAERAIEAYRRVLEFDDRYLEALVGLAEVALDQGDLDRAREAALDAVDAGPDDADAHFVLGRVRRAANEREAAREAFERAVEIGGEGAARHRAALGRVAMESGDLDAAFEHLDRATELEPENGAYVAEFAEALLRADEYARLRDLLERPADWNDTPAWRVARPLFMAVSAGLRDGDLEPAVEAFETAVEKHAEALPIEADFEVLERYALVVDDPVRAAVETMIDILEGRAELEALRSDGHDDHDGHSNQD